MCNTNLKNYGILNVKFHKRKFALKMVTKMPEQATNFSEFVAKKVPLYNLYTNKKVNTKTTV